MIRINNLNYDNLITNFNLEITNEVVCLIGPSGCGKTTLFKILINQVKDYTGDINIVKPGYLPQNNLLLNHLTVEENIKLVTDMDVTLYTEKFNLDKTKYPPELSGGMKSKVSILRTLLMGSDTILFDEPFTGIDVITKYELLPWLKEQIKDKHVFYITHDIHEALEISDRIITVDSNMNITSDNKTSETNFEEIIKKMKV